MKSKKTTILALILSSFLIAGAILVSSFLHQKADEKAGKDDIRIEKFKKYVPKKVYDFNFELAENKGYSTSKEHITSEYLDLQSKYNQVLSVFLEEKLSIAQLNGQLEALGTTIVPKTSISEINSVEGYYRNNSYLNSDYFYLRNNIKVERLEKSDVELLNSLDINNPADKEKLIDMVSRTFIDVLKVETIKPKHEDYNVMYTNGGSEIVNHKAIIFWLSTKTDRIDGDEADRQRDNKKLDDTEKLAEEYSLIFSEELNCEVKIFVHTGELPY